MMRRFANLHATRPRLMAMLVCLITVVAIVGLSRIEFDDDPRAIFRVENNEYSSLEQFYADFGQDDQDVYLVINGDDLFTADAMGALQGFYQSVKDLPEVESLIGLFDIRKRGPIPLLLLSRHEIDPQRLARARREILTHPFAVGQFISADGKTALFVARLIGANLPISELEPVLQKLRTTAEKPLDRAGLQLRLAGHPPTRVDLLRTLRSEVVKFAAVSAMISGLIAVVVFRRAAAIMISLLGPIAGVIWTLGAMGWLGVKIDPLSVVLPTLLFVVGFTDSVHLLFDTQGNRSAGLSPRQAAIRAVEHLGPACLLTALTTAAGFGSLTIARTECIQRFGLTCACGTMIMFAAVQLVVPVLELTSLGSRLGFAAAGASQTITKLLSPAYNRLLHYPRLVAAVSVVFTAVCFVTSLQLQSDQRWTESLPDDSQTVLATAQCDAAFGGSMFAYIVITWPDGLSLKSPQVLEALQKLHSACDESKVFRGPVSVLSLLDSMKRPDDGPASALKHLHRVPPSWLRRFVRSDLRKATVAVHVPDIGSAKLAAAFDDLERRIEHVRSEFPDYEMGLTGTVVVAAENIHQMIADLAWSLTVAGALIFLMMTVLFRSFVLGLLSVVPNMFPQAITAALLVWFDEPLTVTAVLTFCVCFGLSVDDTVHFLMRYCQERGGVGGPRAAILRTFTAVGGVMITTSLVLIGGFLAMLISRMPAVRVFAGLSCITLLAAAVGDLVMLPSLILCITPRRNIVPKTAPEFDTQQNPNRPVQQ